jgi:hypothetical protein
MSNKTLPSKRCIVKRSGAGGTDLAAGYSKPIFLSMDEHVSNFWAAGASFDSGTIKVQACPVPDAPQSSPLWQDVVMYPDVGGVLGATLGHAAGKEIKVSHGNLGGLGALLGIVAGVDITCELVKPNTTSVTEGSRTVTTGQATSGVACNVAGTTVIVNTTDHCVTLAKKIAEGGGTQSVQLAILATVTGSIGVCRGSTFLRYRSH